jgi:hypothetical protein
MLAVETHASSPQQFRATNPERGLRHGKDHFGVDVAEGLPLLENLMKLTIESTTKIVTLVTPEGEIPARIWEGRTESNIPIHCYIARVAVDEGLDPAVYLEFERELKEQRVPSVGIAAIPMRLIL